MKFEVTILGNNAAIPSQGRFPSAQVVNHHESLFLIDCGEGTQIRMSDVGVKRMRIDHIFISHLHGDHVFGLPGLITSYQHMSRKTPLHIYGPAGIRQMIDTVLRLSRSVLTFDILYHELEMPDKQKILDTRTLKVYAFPLLHRVTTYGFLFVEKPGPGHMTSEAIQTYGLNVAQIKALKAGETVILEDGKTLDPEDVLESGPPPRSYAYCSDTMYHEDIIPWIEDVSLLYHEATFLHALLDKAIFSKHSTALEAGTMAYKANAGRLLIGHFSSRYETPDALVAEAREIFRDTEAAVQGETYQVENAGSLFA